MIALADLLINRYRDYYIYNFGQSYFSIYITLSVDESFRKVSFVAKITGKFLRNIDMVRL